MKISHKILFPLSVCAIATSSVFAQGASPNQPTRNPALSAAIYATTHFDSVQTDSFPYPAPRVVFHVDLRKAHRVAGGPAGYLQLASTSPQYMLGTSTGGINYIDVSNGGFRSVAHIATPGTKNIPQQTLDNVLAQRFTSLAQVEKIVSKDLGVDWSRIASNIYMFVGSDNTLYAATNAGKIHAYGLVDPANPAAGIKVLRTLDFNPILKKVAMSQNELLKKYGAIIVGVNPTYDGKMVILTNASVSVIDPSFKGEPQTLMLGPDEFVSNSIAIDEKGGIYFASDTTMHKFVWTGKKLSTDAADGAWSSPYDFGRGTGSTPTLMGFGNDPDKLVVITDGSDHMKIVGSWRDQIPANFKQQPGPKSRRIANQLEITAGLSPKPEFIQSEQSVVVNGYGAFVVNNIRKQGAPDKLIDVLAGGPVFDPPSRCRAG